MTDTVSDTAASVPKAITCRKIGEVFVTALWLGLTSFGGPIAHIGYFERTYVRQRRWVSPQDFTGLVALCQMIPGPASSQLGYLIGLKRAGWGGALAAWLGFTLPSALLMFGFALLAPKLGGPMAAAALHGLMLIAIPVVAQAVWNMARSLGPGRPRIAIALCSAAVVLMVKTPAIQSMVLAIGLVGGLLLCRDIAARTGVPNLPVGKPLGIGALALFLILLVGLPFLASPSRHSIASVVGIFYRSGALVFGGGHVVLPLLRDALVPTGWLPDTTFLAGYGAAQAMPGPLFTFAAYLGPAAAPHGASLGTLALWSAAALTAIFLPGLLIAMAGGAVWNWVGHHALARGALAGVNAAVVGILGAALYTPVWTSAVASTADIAIVVLAFFLLERWRLPPIGVVAFTLSASLLVA